MPRPSTTLQLGAVAPEFQLRDAVAGVMRSLTELLRDKRGLLLVFHRGMW